MEKNLGILFLSALNDGKKDQGSDGKDQLMLISPKTMIVFLVIALIFTLTSTFLNIHKISFFNNLVTGQATNTTVGTATLTVSSATALSLKVSSIAFGSGFVNTTTAACTYCNTDTEFGPTSGNDSCCGQFNNVTAGFLVENTGNENVTLNFTCAGSCTAAAFINGTSPSFQFKITNATNGIYGGKGKGSNSTGDSVNDTLPSCGSGNGSSFNYSSWTNMGASSFNLCGKDGTTEYYFGSAGVRDAFVMDLKIQIPSDALTSSVQTATITFAAASAG